MNRSHPSPRRSAAVLAAALLAAAGCGGGGGGGTTAAPPPAPTLAISPASGTIQAGEGTVPLAAALANSTDAIAWSLSPSGAGSLSAGSGAAVTYTPPAFLQADLAVTVTAAAAGLSRSATLTVTPSAAVALSASPRTASTVELSFAGAYTTPAAFDVYRSTAASTLGTLVASGLPGTAASWHDSGLAGGTTYQYTVEATTAGGRTYRSAQIEATTLPAAAFPQPPTGFRATFVPRTGPLDLDHYTLDWDPYPGANEYIVQSTPVAELVGNGSLSALEGITTSPTLDYRTVTAGTTLYFWVEAYDTVGKRLSAPAVVRVDDGSLPGMALFVPAPVLDAGASAVDLDVYHLYFYGAPGAAAHHVYVGTDPTVLQPHTVATPALDGAPTSLAIQTVKPGYYRMDVPLTVLAGLGAATVQLAVEAVAPGGPGYPSSTPWLAVTLPPAPTPPALTGLGAARRSPRQNDLSWPAAGGATGYVVYRLATATDAPTAGAAVGTPTGTSFSDTAAVPGAVYYYRVSYVNPKGESAASEAVRVQTLFDGPPLLDPFVLVIPFNWNAGLTWIGRNDGTSFHVYSWYGRSLVPLPIDSSHLELTVSPGPDGMTPWGARARAPLTVILTPLPLPVWGCWWLREVYPDGSESPLSLPACMAFPCP